VNPKKLMMKAVGIVTAGLLWATIALAVLRCFGSLGDAFPELAFEYVAAGVMTSGAITWLYSRRIFRTDVRRDWTLPLATLGTAVPLWSTCVFSLSALIELGRRSHPFDDFWFFTLYASALSFTVLLPLTYFAAYFTQRFVARCGGIKSA